MQINQRQLVLLVLLWAFAVENAQCDILGTTAYRPRRIVGGACVVVAVLGKYIFILDNEMHKNVIKTQLSETVWCNVKIFPVYI